jgi:formiminotetrahydrofolate cyclodeaminase
MTESTTTALGDLLDTFASSDPLPGGGSAAALTGSIGVSLLLMVTGMAKTRTGAPEEVADLAAAAARLRPLRERLIALIDEDSAAYLSVLEAFRIAKATAADAEARGVAIKRAMRAATEVPLETMRACEQALREAPAVVRFGNPNAVTDAAVGARLLLAALEGAGLNVAVNLPGVRDPAYVRDSAAEREALLLSARNLARQVGAGDDDAA